MTRVSIISFFSLAFRLTNVSADKVVFKVPLRNGSVDEVDIISDITFEGFNS